MFKKVKKPESYSIEDATRELDVILAKAQAAFVHSDRVVDLLDSRTAAIRAHQVAIYSSAPAFVSGNL